MNVQSLFFSALLLSCMSCSKADQDTLSGLWRLSDPSDSTKVTTLQLKRDGSFSVAGLSASSLCDKGVQKLSGVGKWEHDNESGRLMLEFDDLFPAVCRVPRGLSLPISTSFLGEVRIDLLSDDGEERVTHFHKSE